MDNGDFYELPVKGIMNENLLLIAKTDTMRMVAKMGYQ